MFNDTWRSADAAPSELSVVMETSAWLSLCLTFNSCFFSQLARLCECVRCPRDVLRRLPSSHPETAATNCSGLVTGSRNTFELTGNERLNRPKSASQTWFLYINTCRTLLIASSPPSGFCKFFSLINSPPIFHSHFHWIELRVSFPAIKKRC